MSMNIFARMGRQWYVWTPERGHEQVFAPLGGTPLVYELTERERLALARENGEYIPSRLRRTA